MKEPCITGLAEIKKELSFLIARRIPLTFCQHGGKVNKVFLHDILAGNNNLLVLGRDDQFEILDGPVILFYHAPQQPLLGFEVAVVKTETAEIRVSFPIEIFRVERRRLSRITTSGKSMVSFMMEGGARLSSCKVKNISLEGARITGKAKYDEGTILSPLTFTLGLRYEGFEKVIIVSEATIVRINKTSDGSTEYGIHFNAGDADQDKLEQYIMLRHRENSDLE